MSSHSDRMATALLEKVSAHYPEMLDRIKAYGAAVIHLKQSSDLLDVMRRTEDVILTAKAIGNMGDDVDKQLRVILAAAITESGATGVETTTHIAETRKAARYVRIIGTVPPEYMTTPDPIPDRKRMQKDLEHGRHLDFAELSNGGPDVLVLRLKKDAA